MLKLSSKLKLDWITLPFSLRQEILGDRKRHFLTLNLKCTLLAYSLLFIGCSNSQTNNKDLIINKDSAFNFVKEIVELGPHPSGSENAKKCARFIYEKSKEFGYEPIIDEWEEITPSGTIGFRNIYSSLQGSSNEFIILASHYDTKKIPGAPNFVGANDGSSSTGLLLELMRVLKTVEKPTNPSVRFVFFDGEEAFVQYSDNDGLYGSKRYAKTLKESGENEKCKAMILLDMIGDSDLSITLSPNDNSDLVNRVFSIAKKQGKQDFFGFFLHGNILDDHVPFKKIGIPAIDIIDFKYGPNNSFWHTNQDTLDKISRESLATVGNVVLQLITEL